ncbi:MAG: DUF839 domain-containing protein [Myxococcales bacterium]|nr:DUF839 domain-containing protein [Myxococcales bacterium]
MVGDASRGVPSWVADGAIIVFRLEIDAPNRSIDRWMIGELDAIVRGHSGVGNFLPLRRSSLGAQPVTTIRSLGVRALIDWRDAIGGRSIFAAPTPIAFDPRGGGSVWVAHGALTGEAPTASRPGSEQHDWIDAEARRASLGRSAESLDEFVAAHKRQVGATWLPLRVDPDGDWSVDPTRAARALDATDSTRIRMRGRSLRERLFDDRGVALATDEVAGVVTSSCGALTPWGTLLLGERDVGRLYGELETALGTDGQIDAARARVELSGFAPGSAIEPTYASHGGSDFGRVSDPRLRHSREAHGHVLEVGSDGAQHVALGALGRGDFRSIALAPLSIGAPIVLYALDGRGGGTLFKYVSRRAVTAGDSDARIRELLSDGRIYVAHVDGLAPDGRRTVLGALPSPAAPASGRWIELSVASEDAAPRDRRLVREVLADPEAAGVGAFVSDDLVREALVTAARKIGVLPLDGARSMSFDALHRRLIVASHGVRNDRAGSINAIVEAPLGRRANDFEWSELWHGSTEQNDYAARHPAAVAVDRAGLVWFATECEARSSGCDDREGLYVLDVGLDRQDGRPSVRASVWGRAFRVAFAPPRAAFSAPLFDLTSERAFVGVHRRVADQS